MRRPLLLLALILLLALVAVSRFTPTVKYIEVSGNVHYRAEEVLRLAKLAPGDPFFWITRQRLSRLERDPWIQRATVVKRWPDQVSVAVLERRPAAVMNGQAYARDGTLLPGATAEEKAGLTQITGWGEDRSDEAFALLDLLADSGVKVLSYSPAGFAIELAQTQLFTPNLAALRANWASFVSQEGTRSYVYPWGVSAAHD